jgi:flagellar brake protein
MATPEEKPKNQRTDNIENLDQYMLHSKSEIVTRLKQLVKGKPMVTAHCDNGLTMNTSVIDIIREMELVVLDYGIDERLVQQVLQSGRVIFKSQLEGVTVQFTATSLTKAKYQNEPVIAAPIPASMLWLQRRQAYRVRIPLGMPIYCDIPYKQDTTVKLKLFDISAGGLSLNDDDMQLQVDNGVVLEKCTLDLPGHGKFTVDLAIRTRFPISRHDPSAGQRLGCAFYNLGMTDGAIIQRYIHTIEALRKRTED